MKLRYDMVQCYVVRAAGLAYEFLQLRRAPGDFMAGAWATVTGRIEGSETAWQAALRELREETGLVPIEFYQLDRVNTFYLAADDNIWHCPGFCAIVAADAPVTLNEEHDAYRWVPQGVVLEHFLWPGERDALRELCEQILNDGPAKPYMRIRP